MNSYTVSYLNGQWIVRSNNSLVYSGATQTIPTTVGTWEVQADVPSSEVKQLKEFLPTLKTQPGRAVKFAFFIRYTGEV